MRRRALDPNCTPHHSRLYLPLSHTITLNLSNVTWSSYEAKPGCCKTFFSSCLSPVQEITQMQSLQSGASTQCGQSVFGWDKSGFFFVLLFRLLFSVFLCIMLAILVIWTLEESSSGSQACMSISCCLHISSLARECSGTLPAASRAFSGGNHWGKFWISLKLII